ncbi:7122_t:CDS:2 [Acaulospora morrowiae]|uniref:7122_t:CDS:1 n=1 Tax=Acaulospora morrowiae TaxID=94023 RepID=A0A9N9F2D0_9GLOM|nr:7122_t:CDS:2 [Acaulospora morrowiae]
MTIVFDSQNNVKQPRGNSDWDNEACIIEHISASFNHIRIEKIQGRIIFRVTNEEPENGQCEDIDDSLHDLPFSILEVSHVRETTINSLIGERSHSDYCNTNKNAKSGWNQLWQ